MSASIESILTLIEELADEERFLLQQRLNEKAESLWREEAERARKEAERAGVDDATIDLAIRRHRYGA